MHDDPKPIHAQLTQQRNSLGNLLARAERIRQLNELLRQWTQERWLQSVRVANIREDTLVLFVASAAVLIPLRRREAALLDHLRQTARIPCTRVEIKVRPVP